tara:strand:+ start:4035 stop:5012 length:978 start_codon:yes stop_codon:yes gene_type:complete
MMSDEDLAEFTTYMAGKSLSTIRQYRQRVGHLYKHFQKPITDITIDEFIGFVKGKGRPNNEPLNPNTASQYINALNKYWFMKEKKPTEFIDYRNKVLDGDIQKYTKKTNNELNKHLPNMDFVMKNEEKHKKNKNTKAYMMSYLCRTFYTRNLDLDVKIITSRSEIKDDSNYLLLLKRPNRVEYIRNKYKTVSKYGAKTFIIVDKDFVRVANEQHKKDDLYLFDNRPTEDSDKDPATAWRNYESSCCKTIKRNLGGLGEGLLLKIQINNIKDKNELVAIEESRGTSVSYLLRSYNTDYPKSNQLENPLYEASEPSTIASSSSECED